MVHGSECRLCRLGPRFFSFLRSSRTIGALATFTVVLSLPTGSASAQTTLSFGQTLEGRAADTPVYRVELPSAGILTVAALGEDAGFQVTQEDGEDLEGGLGLGFFHPRFLDEDGNRTLAHGSLALPAGVYLIRMRVDDWAVAEGYTFTVGATFLPFVIE